MMDVVYAKGSQPLDLPGGGRVQVKKGTHWPATDPAVRAFPHLFSGDPRWGLWYTEEPDGWDAPVDAPIETASAGPGEKRSVRRG
jgi:hypothetical protein